MRQKNNGRSFIYTGAAKVRMLLYGPRKLEEYERLAKYQKREDLVMLCRVRGIDHDPEATKLMLALLITEHRSTPKPDL